MAERSPDSALSRDDLQFQVETYEKCLKIFDHLEDYLGIKLYVHADAGTLEDGQIFIFNHFARFETVIPVYIFYQRLGKFTRTIADHQLLEGNEALARFLRGAGTVPNDMEGLLPFLAAELLKGHKVVIFPEGSMVKNKQVMDEEGQFGIFSHSLKSFRKHHTGAAVLALTLDLFKHRIKELFRNKDHVRLDHWCEALEFADHETLRNTVEKPTLIVPGTITFSPIRIGPNLLSKAARLLSGEISGRTLEEIIIEGNLLLKNTDMDIRFGTPIRAHHHWSWWQDRLVKSYFLSIHSLDEFFSLKKRTETWSERLLARIIYRETGKIRDAYIKGMYQGVTVNIAHLASVLIFHYLEQGRKEIDRNEFQRVLYFTIKELQKLPDINLHHHLIKPEKYWFLLQGKESILEQFLRTAQQAGLVTHDDSRLLLRDKLLQTFDTHSIRLENPVLVSANEVSPVPEVKSAVATALGMATNQNAIDLAYRLWDDELRAFAWDKEKYSNSEYHEINQHETATQARDPYLLTRKEAAPGILLIHGFLSSPPELADYGEHLHELGFNVLGMRLPGHGTSPCDLNERHWQDWLESVARNYGILSAFSETMHIVGFSTGGTLALLFSAGKPEKLGRVATICAAIKLRDKKLHFAPFLDKANRLVKILPKIDGIMNYKNNDTEYGDTNYKSIPISALSELHELTDQTRKKLPDVEVPILIVQSDADPVVEPESAAIIQHEIGSTQKELQWLHSNNHHVLRNNIAGSWEMVDNFLLKE